MKNLKHNWGFSLAEIIMTILIILTIWIIWVTYSHSYKLSQYNTRRIVDIDTLQNTINAYYEVNKIYPEPNWNKQYYDENGIYTHSGELAYWVSWFVTTKTFPKQFMNYLPVDPQSNNFYAYAKTNWDTLNYQFATLLNNKWSYSTYIKWDFPWEDLSWIIKEYGWPNFLIHWSEQYLPYNPYELKLIWNINFYSWSIKINDSDIIREIVEWDILKISTWWIANVYLSDWSELQIWDETKETKLVFTDLKYKNNDNIVTKVLLTLNLWEVWVKAPKLEQDSEFKIETDNAAASLRWTVFWMSNEWNGSWSINLIEWKIEVEKKVLENDNTFIWPDFSWSWFIVEDNKTYMEVKPWEDSVLLKYSTDTDNTIISTWNLDNTIVNKTLEPISYLNSSYIPKILDITKSLTWMINLSLENKWANFVKITWSSTNKLFPVSSNSWVIELNNITWFEIGAIKIQLYASWAWFVNQLQSWIKEIEIPLWLEEYPTTETPKDKKCNKWSSLFAHFWCRNNNLLAYAQYSESWDIFLYDKNWNIFPGTSSGILTSGEIVFERNLEKIFLGTESINLDMPFKNDPSFRNQILNKFKNKIWFNTITSGNIKYDISSLGLKNKFDIRIQIKWKYLKQILNNSSSINGVNLIKIWDNQIFINDTRNLKDEINNNDLYKIKLSINWDNKKIEIIHTKWPKQSLLLQQNITLNWNLWDLYIWSDTKWNNNINFIKIFSIN